MEISHGKQGLGNYYLHSQFAHLVKTEPTLIPEENIYSLEEIVVRIKDARVNSPPQTTADTSLHENNDISTSQLSQFERARRAIEENRVSMDPKLHTFTVMGTERPHVVILFPKETCSCPFTSECYHSQNEYWTDREKGVFTKAEFNPALQKYS